MAKPNWKNRTLFHGDNLDFMRAMNSESVDLIATDPPFNKGRDFHATPDSLSEGASFQDRWSWEKDVQPEWLEQIQDDWPAVWAVIDWSRMTYGDDMGAFLCFMAVRLLEMRRILKPTGTLYLHCDPTASHYLKTLLDAIFGREMFMNEVIWHYKSFHGQTRRYFAKKHDIFLVYTRSDKWTFNRLYNDDNTHTVDYKRWRRYLVNERYILGRNMPTQDTRFVRYLKRWMKENDREPGPDDVVLEVAGQSLDTVWHMKPVDPKDTVEKVGYPTQKPLALYERIIRSSSNEGDIVLDPFAGCATTLVIAERLDRKWVGIDIWDDVKTVILERLKKEHLIESDTFKSDMFSKEIIFTKKLPDRTDDGEEAVPYLQVTEVLKEPAGPKLSRKEMKEKLLKKFGWKCRGCDRQFDDERYLELDHNAPRASGGINHISNRILLCGPCNKLKSNIYTLDGLRLENSRRGYMVK